MTGQGASSVLASWLPIPELDALVKLVDAVINTSLSHLDQVGLWTFALEVIAALSLKAALIDPFATVALIQVYDRITAGQTPNPEWAARLESMSGKFRGLTQKARDLTSAPAPKSTQSALVPPVGA